MRSCSLTRLNWSNFGGEHSGVRLKIVWLDGTSTSILLICRFRREYYIAAYVTLARGCFLAI